LNKYCRKTELSHSDDPQKGQTIILALPYSGLNSDKIGRQIKRLVTAVAPRVQLRLVFKAAMKLNILSKLKSDLPVLSRSHVIYRINCKNCEDFYIGKTKRTLNQRILEHKSDSGSALYKHTLASSHHIDYENPIIVTGDSKDHRLYIKETFVIQESFAFKSLNNTVSSKPLSLFV
jgi:hypothetical protein